MSPSGLFPKRSSSPFHSSPSSPSSLSSPRLQSGHAASRRLIHRHMQGVARLVDKWKSWLVGAGGGSGEAGAYDDPYYFCYDQVPSTQAL